MDSFFLGAASVNEFSRLQRVQSAVAASELNRCRVTKIDSFSSRLCQTPNSSGCCSQRVQPAISANEIKRSASMIVLSMTIVIVMFWRWRCFFLFPSVPVHLTLTIRFPQRAARCCNHAAMAVPTRNIIPTSGCCRRNLTDMGPGSTIMHQLQRVQSFVM